MRALLVAIAFALGGCVGGCAWGYGGNGNDMGCGGEELGGCNSEGDWEWNDCGGGAVGNSLGMFGLIGVGLSRKRKAR